jgi:hypothetical protein
LSITRIDSLWVRGVITRWVWFTEISSSELELEETFCACSSDHLDTEGVVSVDQLACVGWSVSGVSVEVVAWHTFGAAGCGLNRAERDGWEL